MELQLKKAGHDYYEPLYFAPFSCETMRENIVPDSLPDIARIVDAAGLVYVTDRELTGDGRFCASGNVDVSVLYIPEREEGPRALHFQLPFQCYGEGQGSADCECLDIRGEIRGIDARALNPRKVLTRADLVLTPSGCRHVTLELATGAEGDQVQLLPEKRTTRVCAGVREKEFSFTEELPLPTGRGGAEEVLSTRVEVKSTDCKLIGSKLVVKGLVSVSVLYRETGGRTAVLQQELPFSQIIDGSGFQEEWECEAAHRLLRCECRIGGEGTPEDAYVLTLELQIRARATVWREEELAFIADLYSTASAVECRHGELELSEDCQRSTRRQNARELLETGVAVKSVVDTAVSCGAVQTGGGELRVPVRARCLYLDENDVLGSVSREFTVACPAEGATEDGACCRAEASCGGDVLVNVVPEGIELRLPLEYALTTACRRRYACVCGGETVEDEAPSGPRPSLILRKLGAGESLWSVAKQYRTTCRGILSVNELADESEIAPDQLLLIPRTR